MKIQIDDLEKLVKGNKDTVAGIDIIGPVKVDLLARNDRKVLWLTAIDEHGEQMFTLRICRIEQLTLKSGDLVENDNKFFNTEVDDES